MKFKTNRIGLLILASLLGSLVAFAQGPNVNGTYEGMVKMPNGQDAKISLDLKTEGTKVTGTAKHDDKTVNITEGKLENGTLTLVFDTKDHTFTGKVDGDKITGEATHGTQKIALELKKANPAAAPAAPAPVTAPAAGAVNLTGQWDAVADANGQPFPFLLTLKVDGENVTGNSSSQLGDATVKGTWKDSKLVFQVEGQNGTINMSASVIDGKLSGEFDYAGQLQGKWVAVRKN